jgi:hypothetical protein
VPDLNGLPAELSKRACVDLFAPACADHLSVVRDAVVFAELARAMIRDRVLAGLDRAQNDGAVTCARNSRADHVYRPTMEASRRLSDVIQVTIKTFCQ